MAMQPSKPSASDTISQAMFALRDAGRQISRQVLVEITKLPMGIVDDHVRRMIEHGRLRRVANGVVELIDVFPLNRPISKTVLSNGLTKIEIDDLCLDLTPGEARVIGQLFHGEAMELANLRGERETHDLVARLERKLEEQGRQLADGRRRIEEMTKAIVKLRSQAELAFDQ